TLRIQYGTGARLHGSLLYIPMSVSSDVLPFVLEDSLEQQIILPGASDLLIDSADDELRILFCHESDIHVDGSNEALLQRFISCPELTAITFFSQAKLPAAS